jgi:trk system potassium uptake protein
MIEKVYRPRSVRQIRVGRGRDSRRDSGGDPGAVFPVAAGVRHRGVWIALIERGGIDLVTAFSASASTLNNIGPGFSMIGATENYGFFSPASKWLLSLLMLLGRLELYSILVLFAPHFWRRQ